MADEITADDVVIPALLREARVTYAIAIRERLAIGEYDDMPHNGPYVLGGMANHGIAPEDLIRGLHISKQAASQLVDTLVIRGYLDRQVNPDDRRRVTLELTDRGRGAAAGVQAGVQAVDAELLQMIGAQGVASLREGLIALIDVKERMEMERHH
jgi:DNA-binding MarR family transcriptional regulator